ncbi:phosphatase PAP2 family protein [Spirosoma soli]|uniref:Phosphatase PAP2 family protein n=1 Tax=Spirosoma soli TaxID=1770529 RepID=A0ABW5M6R5_9BACT
MTIKRSLLSFLLSLHVFVAVGQDTLVQPVRQRKPNPYQLSWKVDASLIGLSGAAGISALVLEQQVQPYVVSDLSRFDRSQINAFDRGATYRWSPRAFDISDQALTANFVATGLVALPTLFRYKQWVTVPVMYLEVLALPTLVQQTVKNIVLRTRPYVYNPDVPLDPKLTPNARQSFFSGHAGTSFATAVFAAEMFRHYYPNSKLKPVVWVVMLGLASTTSVMRYEAGYHYPSDILVGAAFGALVGWGIPKLHEVKSKNKPGHQINIRPWSNGSANGAYICLTIR